LPADLIRAARKNRVIRDGWASAFFHPYLDLSYLQELVSGIRGLGYKYVPLTDSGPMITRMVRSATSFSLSFASQQGQTYSIEYKRHWTDSTWSSLTVLNGDGGTLMVSDPATEQSRFYRIRVQ